MAARTTPPFRADHVGSLLRPPELLEARVASETCLRRTWWVQRMTSMLHRFFDADVIQSRLQLAELEYVTSSRVAATMLAEDYTGLPWRL